MRSFRALIITAAGAALTGCASFNSMPDPVLTVVATDAMINNKSVDGTLAQMEVLEATNSERSKPYRNQVIASYLAAADARYVDFLRSLSRQTKAGNFGLDLAALGLSNVASIAKGAANELSAGAALASGARGSLNKEVYFEKTLPALLSAMEARRLKVRAEIETRMKESVTLYPLEQGFADIMRYQMSTTLDGAIQEITSSAGAQETEAQKEYEDAVDACDPPAGLEDSWATVSRQIFATAKKNEPTSDQLKAVATMLGAESKEDAFEQGNAIMDALERACSIEKANATLALLPAQGG